MTMGKITIENYCIARVCIINCRLYCRFNHLIRIFLIWFNINCFAVLRGTNGSIFSIKSSGRFQAYSQPALGAMITNGDKGPWWDVEELRKAVKEDMLGPDYKAPGKAYGWGR